VVAVGPGQDGGERAEHVVEGPGDDHVVVGREQEGDDHRRQARSCKQTNIHV